MNKRTYFEYTDNINNEHNIALSNGQKCLKYKDQLTAAECDELEDADNYDDGCEDEYRNFHDFACKNVPSKGNIPA